MCCAGPSYGQLIFCNRGHCLVVDPFTGAKVSPPHLPYSDEYKKLGCQALPLRLAVAEYSLNAILTAPLSSPNSHLLVWAYNSLFNWPVGSDYWSQVRFPGVRIEQIVEFNGQVIALDHLQRIYTLDLAPQLALQEIAVNCPPDLTEDSDESFKTSWLVVCGNMLLMIVEVSSESSDYLTTVCTLHRLDMSTKPAKWVGMEKLDNWTIFIGRDLRSPPFSCMSPER
jgi:hypothetical protein